jgi:hypothetical protein
MVEEVVGALEEPKNDVMRVLYVYMFDRKGKLYRHANGNLPTFNEIWENFLQMNEELPAEENTGHDVICSRLQELEITMSDKTPQEVREGLRNALESLYLIYRRTALSNKQFVGTSASRLEDIKANGITPENGGVVWLTEEIPWNAEGCHPWSGCEDDESEDEEERKPVKGLILEVDFSQLNEIDRTELMQTDKNDRLERSRIQLLLDGSITWTGTIPWSAVTRYAILDWEEIDGDWEHFVTHRMSGSVESAPFTRWLMGYPVTVPEMVWPLERGFQPEDTSPESNRAWCRYLWDAHPDLPQDDWDEPDYESTVEACPIEDRKWFVEDRGEMLTERDGIEVTVIRETPWSTTVENEQQEAA